MTIPKKNFVVDSGLGMEDVKILSSYNDLDLVKIASAVNRAQSNVSGVHLVDILFSIYFAKHTQKMMSRGIIYSRTEVLF